MLCHAYDGVVKYGREHCGGGEGGSREEVGDCGSRKNPQREGFEVPPTAGLEVCRVTA